MNRCEARKLHWSRHTQPTDRPNYEKLDDVKENNDSDVRQLICIHTHSHLPAYEIKEIWCWSAADMENSILDYSHKLLMQTKKLPTLSEWDIMNIPTIFELIIGLAGFFFLLSVEIIIKVIVDIKLIVIAIPLIIFAVAWHNDRRCLVVAHSLMHIILTHMFHYFPNGEMGIFACKPENQNQKVSHSICRESILHLFHCSRAW